MLVPVHIRNRDTILDDGGTFEISAEEIRGFFDDKSIDSLDNVNASSAIDGQILVFVGGSVNEWQAANASLIGGYTAADFLTDLGAISTSNVSEGANLYFTDERVDDRVSNLLVEGTGIDLVYNIGSDSAPSLIRNCILFEGTIGFKSGLTTPQNIQLVDCLSGVSSGTGTTLDFNGRLVLRLEIMAVTLIWQIIRAGNKACLSLEEVA